MHVRRRPSLRLLAAGALLPLVLGGLAACQGADQAGSSSSSASSPAGPLTAKTLVPALKSAVQDKPSAHVRMALTGNGQTLMAKGDIRFTKDPAMSMTMSGPMLGQGAAEMRVLDGFVYMSIPSLTPAGKFVKLDANDPNGPMGSGIGDLAKQLDPTSAFDAFSAGLRKVDYLGKQTVSGEELSHYRLTVDSKAVAKDEGHPLPPNVPSTLHYDLWLDGQNLMRKLEFTLGKQASVTMTTSNWGEPVTVKAPPKNDIIGTPAA
jgi:hypothetical protein